MPGFTAERSLDALPRQLYRGRARANRGRLVTAQAIHRHPPLKEPLLGSGGSGSGDIVVEVGPAMPEPCVCPCCTIVAGHLVCCLQQE
jgi:hypothetical protein